MKTTAKKFSSFDVLEIKTISHKSAQSTKDLLVHGSAWVKSLGNSLLHFLTAEPELKVWQKTDSSGHSYWCAYDPYTQRSTTQATESEMRAWIEDRYNH